MVIAGGATFKLFAKIAFQRGDFTVSKLSIKLRLDVLDIGAESLSQFGCVFRGCW